MKIVSILALLLTIALLPCVAFAEEPLGLAHVAVQVLALGTHIDGIGANFTRNRTGLLSDSDLLKDPDKEGLDWNGRAMLAQLSPVHARVAIPLALWAPQPGQWNLTDKGVIASFLLLQDIERRGIPVTGTIFDVPNWGGTDAAQETARTIAPDKYADVIEALAQYLAIAQTRYAVSVETLSFNQPDLGANLKFAPADLAAFIKAADTRFKQLSFSPKWLVGDTSTAAALASYAQPLLDDAALAPLLGPLAFQSARSVNASEADYAAIADLAKRSNRPVLCTALCDDDRAPIPLTAQWPNWSYSMDVARACWKCFAQAGASSADYGDYQMPAQVSVPDKPYPAFAVIHQIGSVLTPDSVLVGITADKPSLMLLAAQQSDKETIAILAINTDGVGSLALTGLSGRARLTVVRSTAQVQEKADDREAYANKHGEAVISIDGNSVTSVFVKAR